MSARLSALLVWGLVAAAAVFWTLRLTASSIPVPPATTLAGTDAPSGADLSRLFGVRAPQAAVAAPVAPDVAGRFKLTGVVAAAGGGRGGVALISVDGKPARAYRVGAQIDPQLTLQSVALRSARIGGGGDGSAAFTLELPPPAPPATGTLDDPMAAAAALPQAGVPPGAGMPPAAVIPAGMGPPPGSNAPGMASIMGAPGSPATVAPQQPPPGVAEAAHEEARMRALAR